MLTLITGTPGAGKSLYAVSELARKVPGSTVENNGVAVPRRLLSNVKDLLVEHEHITADDLNRWHEWAQPGDVILFDEVQEVWRPRGLGSKVPDCIAALETHRHKGVDIILVTQHPMLVDPNIRRLVNQHIHVRRIARGWSWCYEWDHCSNISTLKTALQSRIWRYPKDAFSLYKSAQLHTKPATRVPRLAWVGVLALAGLAYGGQMAYARITERFTAPAKAPQTTAPAAPRTSPSALHSTPGPVPASLLAAGPGDPSIPQTSGPEVLGCIVKDDDCRCWNQEGRRVVMDRPACLAAFDWGTRLVVSGAGGASSRPPVPPAPKHADPAGMAAAPG